MKTRIISSFVMAPLLVVVLLGGWVLTLACFIIGIAAIYEFSRGFKNMGINLEWRIGLAAAILLYALHFMIYSMGLFPETRVELYMLWFFVVMLMNLLYLFKVDERHLEDTMATITGTFYIIFFSYHIILLSDLSSIKANIPDSGKLVWLVLITAFCTDIFAYFSGYFFGKRKLCPNISPKKTVEGSIGGIVGSVVFSMIFGMAFLGGGKMILHCLMIGILGGVISQFGDLTASIFKRKMGIKDYGNLIPGHGGVLDRIDSVLFTAPMVYYYIVLFV